ncbi:VanZ family protein [Hydrogenophaga flava]|uniref:VanZ family protein n=1 Tax=Hydrogenophaga flava TaxID=65657 RepID=UPI0008256F2C|nr:VanZ family protein [Hydrogenophaga flava]
MSPKKPPLEKAWLATPLWAAGMAAAVVAVAQVDLLRPFYAQWDKGAHALCFLVTWWVFHRVLGMGRVLALVLAAALGAFIEVHQIGVPGFNASWSDFAADLAGIAAAWALAAAFPARKDSP